MNEKDQGASGTTKRLAGAVATARRARKRTIATVGLASGLIVGAVVASLLNPAPTATDEYQALESSTTTQIEELKAELRKTESRRAQLQSEASNVKARQEATAARSKELDERDIELSAREVAVGAAEVAKRANEFDSGTHLVGTDIQPGTYRSSAGDSCYWERLSGLGGSVSDIIANGNPDGQAIVTISATDAAFESARCGTWSKIG